LFAGLLFVMMTLVYLTSITWRQGKEIEELRRKVSGHKVNRECA